MDGGRKLTLLQHVLKIHFDFYLDFRKLPHDLGPEGDTQTASTVLILDISSASGHFPGNEPV